jgi:membrane protease YdiL (CAAX protease family)
MAQRSTMPDPGSPRLARLGLLAALALTVVVVLFQQGLVGAHRDGPAAEPGAVVQKVVPPAEGQELMMARLAVRLGSAEMMRSGGPAAVMPLVEVVDGAARAGGAAEHIRAAIVAGQVLGAEQALTRLEKAGAELKEDSPLRADVAALTGLYTQPSAPLTEEDARRLVEHHGYFGKVAGIFGKGPDDAGWQEVAGGGGALVAVLVVVGLVSGGAVVVGFGLLVTAVALILTGGLKRRFVAPAPGGSVLVELLAVFIGGFVALKLVSMAAGMALGERAAYVPLVLQWALLLVVFYPLLRGVSWSQTRAMLGLTAERGLLREIGAGVVGYLACLPILIAGAMLSVVLVLVWEAIKSWMSPGAGPSEPPENPLFDLFAQGSGLKVAMVALLATIWAPLCEEIVFRGAAQRHLSAWMHPVVAALPVGIIFAAMHGYPVLLMGPVLALGISFGLLRYWRGSLVASITAHAIHNTAVLGILLTVVGLLTR